MSGIWLQPELSDRIVDFVRERAGQTELPASQLVGWIGTGASKFFDLEIIVQQALEAFPEARPRIISDNSSARLADRNPHRPHSAIGTIASADKLAGRAPKILKNLERKLSEARAQRAENRRPKSERPVRVVS